MPPSLSFVPRRPRRSHAYLDSVVQCVRRVMRKMPVYLLDGENTYRLRIYGIRISRKSDLLQVKLVTDWSTVSFGERLLDQCDDILYESPGYLDFDLELMVSRIGLMPCHRDDHRNTTRSL